VIAGIGQRLVGKVLGVAIDAISWDHTLDQIVVWGGRREPRYVCICNVHSVVTSHSNPEFAQALAGSDLATPDGAPIAWMLRRLGFEDQQRINGPDLMWRYLAAADRLGQVASFYGSTDGTLADLQRKLLEAFPALRIGACISPPFRTLSSAEDDAHVDQINRAGTAVLFVGLGCPKQELWMASHRARISAVQIGVGAAFDFHAGHVSRAPEWMRNSGLEWLHRLCSEPRRLWKRYLYTNAAFVLRAGRQLLGWKDR
jgi:N-acetylglucosaminyldiphosphoundecaprenol N-acetyl-beta-D-mannosaminyltransferase